MKRHFYILAVVHSDEAPPEILDINQRYMHPVAIFADVTTTPEMIPYYAERHAANHWPNTNLADLQMAAYMVTGPHTARLAWHKPAGRVRGQWADWHGNPKRKRRKEGAE